MLQTFIGRLFASVSGNDDGFSQTDSVIEYPALADWLFYYRVQQFIDTFYVGVLGATDYWLRFEW